MNTWSPLGDVTTPIVTFGLVLHDRTIVRLLTGIDRVIVRQVIVKTPDRPGRHVLNKFCIVAERSWSPWKRTDDSVLAE